MTHEERLAALLREEAETVLPTGDGLARIQTRIAARRRSRWLLLPGAAVLTAGAVAAAFVLSGGGSGTTLTQTPTTHGPTPAATPTVTGGGLDHAFENPALWPFTSAQQIAQWRSTYPYANDKTALVQHYLHDVLAVSGFTLSRPCESCDVVDIAVAGRKVGQAALERFFLDGAQVWTISTIGETDLKLLAPGAGEAVSSPTTVTGRITGVDEHVNLALVTQAGATVATGGTQAGSALPWTAQLSWTDTSWSHGAIVARTFSAKDGTLNRLTALPVMRGSDMVGAFAGVRNGRVELFDGTTGAFVRHLTYPPAHTVDSEVAYSNGTLVWVRTSGTCASGIHRIEGGRTTTLLAPGPFDVRGVAVSADGRTTASLRIPCRGVSGPTLVVTGPHARTQTLRGGADARLLDVDDNGWVLYSSGGRAYYDDGTPRASLSPDKGCALLAATLSSTGPTLAQSCPRTGLALKVFWADRSPSYEPLDFASAVTAVSGGPDGPLLLARAASGGAVGVWRQNTGSGMGFVELVKDGSVTSASW
jgi:hypothetical protein